jgi:hypothetical protein
MSFLDPIFSDLREKRLWPVAVVLLAAVVAIPVILAKKTKAPPVAQVTPLAVPVTQLSAVPAVSVQSTATVSNLKGPARDPFTQPKLASTTSTTSTTGTSTTPASSSSSRSTTPTTPTPLTTTPATPLPTSAPKPAPSGLTATQAYRVAVSITNTAGGLDAIDPLERLTILPSGKQPLLVELGVLKGGHRVLFAVQPGTVVSGPGTCTPGPIDCEILSLAPQQIEQLSLGGNSVAQFGVTAITADQYSSAAAADKARRTASAAGGHLLSTSTLGALSLFQYEPSVGAVVDLRDLIIGGS